MIIGERLSELRKDRQLTQSDLAKILGVCTKSVSMYERGVVSPPDDIKLALAKLFCVSVDYLLGLTDIESYRSLGNYVVLPKTCSAEFRHKVYEYIELLSIEYGLVDNT